MGSLNIEITQYGTWTVVTSSGDEYRLDDKDGALLVRATHGGILLKPEASNALEVQGRLARGADW